MSASQGQDSFAIRNRRVGLFPPFQILVLAGALALAYLPEAAAQPQSQPKGDTSKIAPAGGLDGRKLTQQMNCRSCHIIEGDGGLIGPPLDGIGLHRKEEAILERLTKRKDVRSALPDYVSASELMSHVRLPLPQSKAIAAYLVKLPETKLKWNLTGHEGDSSDAVPAGSHFTARAVDAASTRGKQLYFDHGCAACHSIGGRGGGNMGPSLAGVGARRSRNFIEKSIADGALIGANRKGEYKRMGYRMPPARVSKQEVRDITDFLLTIPERH